MVGVPFVAIRYSAFNGFWFRYGGSPSIISTRKENIERSLRKYYTSHLPIAIMPKLHMSTFGPYSLRVTTSGAIQYGVPTIVVRFAWAGSEICAQNPKLAVQTMTNIILYVTLTKFNIPRCLPQPSAICPSVIKLVVTSCGKKVVQHCCFGMQGSGGELPVAIALDLVLVLRVFDEGVERRWCWL